MIFYHVHDKLSHLWSNFTVPLYREITGCNSWDENRVHTTVHGNISPTPTIDVKQVSYKDKRIIIIRVEEGHFPPYITNKGIVYERVSSGSYPIKESGKLSQLYYKRKDQIERLKNKIEFGLISDQTVIPSNLCGCIDIGFALTCNGPTEIQKKYPNNNISEVADRLRQLQKEFSISKIGNSYFISVGKVTYNASNGDELLAASGVNNYIEIMVDGSARMRILLTNLIDKKTVNIISIFSILDFFKEAYTLLIGKLENIFVEAHKYQQLQVINQFIPEYIFDKCVENETIVAIRKYISLHKRRYGNNIIINGNRLPINDYQVIDKHYFDTNDIEYSNRNLIDELFLCYYSTMGYIDPFDDKQLSETT